MLWNVFKSNNKFNEEKKIILFIGANKACNNAFFINKSEVDKLNIDLPDQTIWKNTLNQISWRVDLILEV